MWGSIIGDIIGSTFSLENHRSIYFEQFRKNAKFTDDSIMNIATMSILIKSEDLDLNDNDKKMLETQLNGYKSYESEDFPNISPELTIMELKAFCYTFYNSGFNVLFHSWLENGSSKPYFSYGNGALTRLGPVAFWGHSKGWSKLKTINTALAINNITHNHRVAQKMAEIYIGLIYELLNIQSLSLNEKKDFIFSYIKDFELDTSSTVQYYLINNEYDCSAKKSLEIVLNAFRESNSFENHLSLVVSCGGNTDTYCSIAGAFAEAIWGYPDDMKEKAIPYFNGYSFKLVNYINDFYIKLKS